jgi:hypothetical protein
MFFLFYSAYKSPSAFKSLSCLSQDILDLTCGKSVNDDEVESVVNRSKEGDSSGKQEGDEALGTSGAAKEMEDDEEAAAEQLKCKDSSDGRARFGRTDCPAKLKERPAPRPRTRPSSDLPIVHASEVPDFRSARAALTSARATQLAAKANAARDAEEKRTRDEACRSEKRATAERIRHQRRQDVAMESAAEREKGQMHDSRSSKTGVTIKKRRRDAYVGAAFGLPSPNLEPMEDSSSAAGVLLSFTKSFKPAKEMSAQKVAIPSTLSNDAPKQWYYLDFRQLVQGPFETVQMQSWHRSGHFKDCPDLPVRSEGMQDYVPMSSSELCALFSLRESNF